MFPHSTIWSQFFKVQLYLHIPGWNASCCIQHMSCEGASCHQDFVAARMLLIVDKEIFVNLLFENPKQFFSNHLNKLSLKKQILCYCLLGVIMWSEQCCKSQSSGQKPVQRVVSGKRIPSDLSIYISIPINILQTLPKQKAVLVSFTTVFSVYFWKIKGLSSFLELTKVCDEEDAMVGDV